MKIWISVLAVLWLCSPSFAQELPVYQQYLLNGFLLNPAVPSVPQQTSIRITDRHQWLGVADAPQTQTISIHSRLGNNGLGAYAFADKNGPNHTHGLQISYSRHIPLNQDLTLSLGISAKGYIFSLDESELETHTPNDPIITKARNTCFVPNMNAGVFLYNELFSYGISVAHLLPQKIDFYKSEFEPTLARHYFMFFDYQITKIPIQGKNSLSITPGILIKAEETRNKQIDLNVKFTYLNMVSTGVSFRSHFDTEYNYQKNMLFLIGIKLKNIEIRYAYEYFLNRVQSVFGGGHEFMIAYRFKVYPKDHLCPAYY